MANKYDNFTSSDALIMQVLGIKDLNATAKEIRISPEKQGQLEKLASQFSKVVLDNPEITREKENKEEVENDVLKNLVKALDFMKGPVPGK